MGPVAEETEITGIQPGDLIQLSFDGKSYSHTPVVVYANQAESLSDILVAAHSQDSDNRPLSTYQFQKIRYLHVVGVNYFSLS